MVLVATILAVLVASTRTPQIVHGDEPESSGGGEYIFDNNLPPLTEEQRREIQSQIDNNIRTLQSQGKLPVTQSPTQVSLSSPLQPASSLTDYGYYGISAFVDHNPAYPNQLQDWNCGTRTYDTASGYNHAGTDFFSWPFGWSKMENNQVQIIAAAPGTIVFKQDGNYDKSCSMNNNSWNAVYVQHSDGSVAWYGHMKSGSLTTKGVGENVVAGEYLGVVGSSGSSTGPHLHLEIHNSSGTVIDPFQGPCNSSASWWANQRAYYDSAINKLTVGSAAPSLPSCPNIEKSNEKYFILRGSTAYFATYFRDLQAGQQSQFNIYRPDSSVFRSWTYSYTAPPSVYAAYYGWWSFTLGANEQLGNWRFEVTFNGQTYRNNFIVANQILQLDLPLVIR